MAKNYNVVFYSLEMIIAVGYRVRGLRGTQFRQWATEHLTEYLVKGFTMDDERQTVCGYQCQKATCHWRGRDYVAWFTTRIPLKSGPWKFGGLPGLIMKVYDSRHIYTWEAVSVENGSFPIYQPDEHMYKKSTRQKVWKMQIDWNKRHNELAGVLDFNFHPKTKRYPYDPLELE